MRLISKSRRWAHTEPAARGSKTRERPRNKIASLSLQGFLGAGREASVFVERERDGAVVNSVSFRRLWIIGQT